MSKLFAALFIIFKILTKLFSDLYLAMQNFRSLSKIVLLTDLFETLTNKTNKRKSEKVLI